VRKNDGGTRTSAALSLPSLKEAGVPLAEGSVGMVEDIFREIEEEK